MIKHNRVGLGTFPLAGVFNPITKEQARNIVRKFIDEGGYYIDTAPMYGNGEVEKLLGKVLKTIPREKFYLCSKTIKHIDEKNNLFISGKYKDVIKQIDNSLNRLNLDYLDLLMIHRPDENSPIEETLSAMEELKRKGKVKDLAVSNVNLDELKQYNKSGKIKYVQNRFSLINRSISSGFEKYLLEKNIHLIPYHLLEIGLLTGIAFEEFKLRRNDLRRKLSYWDETNQNIIFEWVRNYLSPISKNIGVNIGQLNISWALHQKYIDFVIVGTTNPEYLSINLKANEVTLNKEILAELENAYNVLVENIKKYYNKTIKEFRGLNDKFY